MRISVGVAGFGNCFVGESEGLWSLTVGYTVSKLVVKGYFWDYGLWMDLLPSQTLRTYGQCQVSAWNEELCVRIEQVTSFV